MSGVPGRLARPHRGARGGRWDALVNTASASLCSMNRSVRQSGILRVSFSAACYGFPYGFPLTAATP